MMLGRDDDAEDDGRCWEWWMMLGRDDNAGNDGKCWR